jgi:hypothetical protein
MFHVPRTALGTELAGQYCYTDAASLIETGSGAISRDGHGAGAVRCLGWPALVAARSARTTPHSCRSFFRLRHTCRTLLRLIDRLILSGS